MLASASPSEPGAAAQDARERRKLEAEVRAFQRMEALAQRRRAGQDRRADRRASDPCTCGRARKAGRLPKPLSIGGPRCNLCTPVPLPPLGSPANPELPDAPTFYPTEEEFRDPLRYIRSVQGQFAHVGIALIQPPPSWAPPEDPLAELRLRQVTRCEDDESDGDGADGGDGAGGVRAGAEGPGGAEGGAPGDAAGEKAGGAARERPSPGAGGRARAGAASAAAPLSAADAQARLRARARQVHDTALAKLPPSKKVLSARLQTVAKRKTTPLPPPPPAGAEGAPSAPAAEAAPPCAEGGSVLAPFSLFITPAFHLRHSLDDVRRMDAALRDEAFPRAEAAGGARVEAAGGEGEGGAEAADGGAAAEAADCAAPAAKAALPGRQPSPEEVEHFFWNVLGSCDEAAILYWSDLAGSAFRAHAAANGGAGAADDGGGHGWALPSLPSLSGSLLRHCGYNMPGVNDPMLYLGILFSMFCWHVEDNYMYSMSYLHAGAPKTWYGVPASSAAHFESVFVRSAFQPLCRTDPTLIFKKSSMVPPAFLAAHGLLPSRALQRPGQFVVTLPQAYHAGFSHGFTVAEAVNFATIDWLPYGLRSVERCRAFRRESVLDLEHMLLQACKEAPPEGEAAMLLHKCRAEGAEGAAGGGGSGGEGEEAEAAAAREEEEQLARAPWRYARRALQAAIQLELRARRRLADSGTSAEGHPLPGLPLRLLGAEEGARALGRGPPCTLCCHVCHLSFVRCMGCMNELLEAEAAAAPKPAPAAPAAARPQTLSARALDSLPVACLAHGHCEQLCARHPARERAVTARYTTLHLQSLSEELRQTLLATTAQPQPLARQAAGGGVVPSAWSAARLLLPPPPADPWLSAPECQRLGLPQQPKASAAEPPHGRKRKGGALAGAEGGARGKGALHAGDKKAAKLKPQARPATAAAR